MQIGRVYDKCDTKCMSVMMRRLCWSCRSVNTISGWYAWNHYFSMFDFVCLPHKVLSIKSQRIVKSNVSPIINK